MKHARLQFSTQPTAPSGGFSIVELLVAMAISLILLGGVVTIYSSSKSTYEVVDRVSRVQENGRFALDAIVRDLRSAGYIGCSRAENVTFTNALRSSTQLSWNFADGVVGHEYSSGTTWVPGLDAGLSSATTGTYGSDALVLRVPVQGGAAGALRLTQKMSSSTDTLKIAAVGSSVLGPLEPDKQVIMVADCHARSVFEITSYTKTTGVIQHAVSDPTSSTPGNETDNIGHAYEINSQIVPMRTVAYYIGSSSPGRIGLWRKIGAGTPEELVEGVERMELRFGFDTNADRIADEYRTANDVTNWGNVISVSIALLARSPEQYGTADTANYVLLDQTFTAPGDRYMRQVFTTTVTLRNRAL